MCPVEELPKDFAAGHDRKLETGVQTVLDELKANPIPAFPFRPTRTTTRTTGWENSHDTTNSVFEVSKSSPLMVVILSGTK